MPCTLVLGIKRRRRCQWGSCSLSAGWVCVLEMDEEPFAELVEEALERIPDGLRELMDNVAIFVEDRGDDPELLGVYEGIPLTERHDYGGLGDA